MLTRALQRITKHPWLVIAAVLGLSALFFWEARRELFDASGALRIDTSLEQYISSTSEKYAFHLETEREFGNPEIVAVAVQPLAGREPDLDFFLTLEELGERLSTEVPAAAGVLSVVNAPRIGGSCLGKSYFYRETAGSVCESVLTRYRTAEACYAQGAPPPGRAGSPIAGGGIDEAIDGGIDEAIDEDEGPLFFDDEGESGAEGAAGLLAGSERSGAAAVPEAGKGPVCTGDVFRKPLAEWRRETRRAAAEAYAGMRTDALLVGDLISRDARTFGVVLRFADAEAPATQAVQEAIAGIAEEMNRQGYPTHFMGQSRQQYEASTNLRKDIRSILPLSLLIMAVVLAVTFRTVRGVLVPLAVVLLGIGWVGGAFGFAGERFNPVTMVLPPLLVCVGSAYVIYFMNQYFLCARDGGGRDEVIDKTLAAVTLPLAVTALTTIAGFAALIVSPIPAIRTLGLYACIGIAAIILMALTLVPSVFRLLPVKSASGRPRGGVEWLDRVLRYVSTHVERHSRRFIFFWIAVGVVAFAGLLQMRIDSTATLFGEETPIMRDLRFIERELGGTNFLRIVIAGTNGTEQAASADTMRRVQRFERSLLIGGAGSPAGSVAGVRIDKVYSPAPYLQARYGALDTLSDLEVRRLLDALRESGGPKFLSADGERLQVTLRLQAEGSSAFLALRDALEAYFADWSGFDVHFTGTQILASESADNIARSQVQSVGLALGIIFIIMSCLFLSPKMGVLALYPNILTIMVFFGILGWLNIPLGVTISVIAAIALGIGVDDTIHYLAHYNVNVKSLRNEREAAVLTVRQVGRPMVSTTFALALGFLVFVFSEMETQILFGALLAFTLFVCLFTDLNFLPSIMARTKLITAWDYLKLDFSPEFIRKIPLFRNMSLRETKLGTLMAYPMDREPGQIVFEEGDTGQELFVVLDGSVEVFYDRKFHGQEQVLATLGVGASFGEMGLFRHSKRVASVRAAERARLLVLNDDVLTKLQRRYPRIAAKMFTNLAASLSGTIRRTDQLFVDRVSQRNSSEAYLQLRNPSEQDLIATVDEILADGVITAEERRALETKIYADGRVSPAERRQLRRIDLLIKQGQIKEEAVLFEGILRHIPPRGIAWIKKRFPVRRYAPGDSVWQKHHSVHAMYVVLSGKLNVRQESDGRQINLRTVFDGELVGEEAVLTGDALRTDWLVAVEEAEVLEIDARGLDAMIRARPKLSAQFAYNLVCMLSNRLQEANQKLYS
ncbi:MAG: cyclic nucleotide-binding domain-containing protein [SAR324 cluster bacterium]|nr:cyclic nucleotide-binding domain-containing protein [SAR324 cluster bacterium]